MIFKCTRKQIRFFSNINELILLVFFSYNKLNRHHKNKYIITGFEEEENKIVPSRQKRKGDNFH